MNKYLTICLAGLLPLAACTGEMPTEAGLEDPTIDLTENGTVVPGVLRVKLQQEPAADISVSSTDGSVVLTGIRTLDVAGTTLKITRMERVFPDAGEFEARTRREGLHLWYNVWYEQPETVSRVAQQVAALDGIALAEPVYAIETRDLKSADVQWALAVPRSGEWLYDDPMAEGQWNLRNKGTESWQRSGADVGLTADCWQQYHGDKRIVVAVVDGGIDVTHPDLAANIWTDTDGSHGKSFVAGLSTLVPYYHATHVAGLVAAVNNNGVGVSSIAGGDGTAGSGVQLMNCQIINARQLSATADYAAAIKYGADKGALISQNSWGYSSPQATAQAEKDAIDYFIKYAGCDNNGNQLPDSPMKGGIVLFATNNHNSESVEDAAPADYEPVVAVAALLPNFTKTSYSDYGSYIDIAAPGGAGPNDRLPREAGILSTYTNGAYEYMAGASMACPQVSAACALIIQKFGMNQPGFTPDKLKDILLGSTTPIDGLNPDYAGKLGTGALNIRQALSMDADGIPVFSLESNTVTDGKLNFKVSSALAGPGVLTLFNATGYPVYRQEMSLQVYSWTKVDIASLAPGYYTLQYEAGDTLIKENFIKQ